MNDISDPNPQFTAQIHKLTGKQQAFVREYLLDFNAAAAAKRAGYRGSPGTLRAIGSQNLHKPAISQAIHDSISESAITPQEIAFRLTRQSRASMASFLSLDPDGFIVFDFKKALASGDLDLIERIKFNQWTLQNGTVRRQVEFKLHSAQKALNLLGKTYQMWQGLDWRDPESHKPKITVDDFTQLVLESQELEKQMHKKIKEECISQDEFWRERGTLRAKEECISQDEFWNQRETLPADDDS